jgi:hypothetical protein
MSYSRRQLYAMGEPLGESVTRKEGGRIIYGGGGGGGPTQTNVTQSNVPDWLRPQVENVLMGAGKNLFQTRKVDSGEKDEAGNVIYNEEITGTKPFVPYSSDPSKYVAGFSPLQQQVQYNAANLQMPGQFNQATGYANAAAQGGLGSAAQAAGYGNAGFQSGQMGQQLGTQGGQYYGNMGAQAGLQGQQSGLLGQQLGIQGGQYYGNMGAQYGAQGAGYGAQAAGLAPQAQQYGRTAADIGQMGLRAEEYGRQVSGQAQNYAAQAAGIGDMYGQMATSPGAYQAYMSPYQQNVTDIQLQGLQRQADIARTQRGAQAARAGAFGGARQAIENAEANRALASQMDATRAQGLQQAYQQAQGNIAQRAQFGLQGLAGAQQGLGTALQGGQLGLSGIGTAMQGQQAGLQGLSTANQLYGTGIQGSQAGMQGAQVGLQGVDRQLAGTAQGMQGAQMAMQGAGVGLQGVNTGLAGTAQGMQGAQVGLQGVSGQQAGYGLANQSAGQLGQLGTQQLAAQQGILGLQNQIGGQQQGQQQQIINQAIQNYAQAQEAPMNAFNQYNALLRGYALPGTTTTQYQAQPTLGNQIAGFGTAGVSALALNNALNPSSGSDIRVKENIERVGTLANGLGLYDFEYKPEFKDHPQCGHGRFRGVMAQEVEKIIPEAVVTMDNGYKAVKYDLVEMELS